MRLESRITGAVDSPIENVLALLDDLDEATRADVLDVAQAAPPYPPAPEVVEHVAAVAHASNGAAYTPIRGLPHLREAFAAELSRDYAGTVRSENVLVTAGCNQAFGLVADALCGPGDEMIVPLPYYFNHDMWLRMRGVRPVYLEPGPGLTPRAQDVEALITARTRAILLVSPGNPSGATVTPEGIAAFADVVKRHGVALVLDETYRSFRDEPGPAHHLFADPAWGDTLVSLHSFSKDLALPGYRVGAVVAGGDIVPQVAKLMDCIAVCAPRLGQEAAWAGLTRANAWRAERSAETKVKRERFVAAMAGRPGGFELLSCGAFFAWVRHPFPDRSDLDVVRDLVGHGVLTLPGTAFLPEDRGAVRISVSNLDAPDLERLLERLVAAGAGRG